jgi:hypothetical protein
MSTAATVVGSGGRALWLRWVIASTLGLAVGQVLFAILDATNGDMGELGDGIAHYVGLPLAGAAFGFAQWRVLRRFVERSAWGIVGGAIGLLVGYILGFFAGRSADRFPRRVCLHGDGRSNWAVVCAA